MGVRGKPEGEPCGCGAGAPSGFPRTGRQARSHGHHRAGRTLAALPFLDSTLAAPSCAGVPVRAGRFLLCLASCGDR